MRAIIFDAVGTLIRPYPSVGGVYARAARAHGVRCGAGPLNAQFRPAYGELMPERFRAGAGFRTSEGRERRWWKKAVGRTFERAGCAPLPPAARDAAFEAFARGSAWRPYADALRTLKRLSPLGLRLGVISNFDSRLRRVLEELELAPFFDSVVISSECGYAKPSPAIFGRALRELGVRPDEALHVGDRLEQDYLGARRAGLEARLLVRSGPLGGEHRIRRLDAVISRVAAALPGRARRSPT